MIKITSSEAFAAMRRYLERYYSRTNSSDIAVILGETAIASDGITMDPAAAQDWNESVEEVRSIPEHDSLELHLAMFKPVGVKFDRDFFEVELNSGVSFRVPIWFYPRLHRATLKQRQQFELSPFGIHWPEIDEDIEIKGILQGAKAPGATAPAEAAE